MSPRSQALGSQALGTWQSDLSSASLNSIPGNSRHVYRCHREG